MPHLNVPTQPQNNSQQRRRNSYSPFMSPPMSVTSHGDTPGSPSPQAVNMYPLTTPDQNSNNNDDNDNNDGSSRNHYTAFMNDQYDFASHNHVKENHSNEQSRSSLHNKQDEQFYASLAALEDRTNAPRRESFTLTMPTLRHTTSRSIHPSITT